MIFSGCRTDKMDTISAKINFGNVKLETYLKRSELAAVVADQRQRALFLLGKFSVGLQLLPSLLAK